MSTDTATFTCRFCRLPSDGGAVTCPHCGAPVDVRTKVSHSGWQEQPPIRDMAKIQFGHSTCQIEGTYVPAADFGLAGDDWIYFSHHSLFWSDPTVVMSALPMGGGWNRTRAGLPLVMMQAHGPGHLALSDDAPGEVVALPLPHGGGISVPEHRFLATTGNVGYRWEQTGVWFQTGQGDDREVHYPLGQFIDRFGAEGTPGLLLLHSPGNTFVRDLAPGETICIQPASLLYKDLSVHMHLHLEYPHSDGLWWSRRYSYRSIWLRLTGPGRVAVQSVFEHELESEYITGSSYSTQRRW